MCAWDPKFDRDVAAGTKQLGGRTARQLKTHRTLLGLHCDASLIVNRLNLSLDLGAGRRAGQIRRQDVGLGRNRRLGLRRLGGLRGCLRR